MGVESERTNKPIAKLLDAAALDLDAARRLLVDPPGTRSTKWSGVIEAGCGSGPCPLIALE